MSTWTHHINTNTCINNFIITVILQHFDEPIHNRSRTSLTTGQVQGHKGRRCRDIQNQHGDNGSPHCKLEGVSPETTNKRRLPSWNWETRCPWRLQIETFWILSRHTKCEIPMVPFKCQEKRVKRQETRSYYVLSPGLRQPSSPTPCVCVCVGNLAGHQRVPRCSTQWLAVLSTLHRELLTHMHARTHTRTHTHRVVISSA